MRIKSYFAPSVQAAITLARREFGDDVTLVTSHVAPPETRHLGEYEVVFAIEETPAQPAPEPPMATVIEPESAKPGAFQELLSEAIAATPSTRQNVPERLHALRCNLIELGIESSVVRALMTLIESHVSSHAADEDCGASTPACRVETHLDACKAPSSELKAVEPIAQPVTELPATAQPTP
ncbi:MAG: hypothetical protein JO061_10025, partial [Acidobacteriaceae bacterium]|nr:hypothetical protein [Acidobacteriaceae bacterium]